MATGYARSRQRRSRHNLKIVTNAHVTKVLIDPESKTATGVEFVVDDGFSDPVHRVVTARKEIIVSSGTMNSPRVLLLSGIGPKEELQRHMVFSSLMAELFSDKKPRFSFIDTDRTNC